MLKEYRKKIDIIDKKILQLIKNRVDLVKELHEYKLENEIPIVDKAREIAVVEKNIEIGKRIGISAKWVRFFTKALIRMSID